MTTPLILSIAIPVVVLAIARVCYRWGYADGQHKIEQVRVRNINALNHAWRAGMLAERMRRFSPKNVSKN